MPLQSANVPYGANPVPGAFFTVDQMDSRATQLRLAYKAARKMMREIADEGQ